LSDSRLMLISSAGGYLPGRQQPFDAASLYGDYTIRTFPSSTPFSALAYAHDHFDHAMIDQDPQVALPLATWKRWSPTAVWANWPPPSSASWATSPTPPASSTS